MPFFSPRPESLAKTRIRIIKDTDHVSESMGTAYFTVHARIPFLCAHYMTHKEGVGLQKTLILHGNMVRHKEHWTMS